MGKVPYWPYIMKKCLKIGEALILSNMEKLRLLECIAYTCGTIIGVRERVNALVWLRFGQRLGWKVVLPLGIERDSRLPLKSVGGDGSLARLNLALCVVSENVRQRIIVVVCIVRSFD